MKYNIKVVGNPQRKKKDGTESIRLLITFNCQKKYLNTGLSYYSEGIHTTGINIVGNNAKEFIEIRNNLEGQIFKIKAIFENNSIKDLEQLEYYLKSKSNIDFLKYFENKLNDRIRDRKVNYNTYKAQKQSYERLKKFKSIITFDAFNSVFLNDFKDFLNKEGYKRNTVWTTLKDLRTYINFAISEGYQIEYCFNSKEFKMPKTQSKIEFLHESEFQEIKNYYLNTSNIYHIEVLKAFIFSCYTGLRISDIKAIRYKNIKNGFLIFEPQKTNRSETKKFTEIEIPLHQFCKYLIKEGKKENYIFDNLPSEQKINLNLKRIAKILSIDKNITFHYSRHTFATRFLSSGGKIEVLQKLLGHESINTTMIYIHIEPKTSIDAINLMQ
jgi:integrase/recombinase XerD